MEINKLNIQRRFTLHNKQVINMYILHNAEEDRPYHYEWAGSGLRPILFEKREEAERYLQALCTTVKYEVRRYADPEWRQREYIRFQTGNYRHVAWCTEDFWFYAEMTDEYREIAQGRYVCGPLDHYAHVSLKDPTKIAYTPSADKGELDIQVTTTPGRYLTKFYPELGAKRIRELVDIHRTTYVDLGEVYFANTSDAIEQVYLDGPDSCMSKQINCYDSDEHPVRVYADGDTSLDLAIAYTKVGDRITARTVCWPEKKLYVRIYGDETKLSILLERAGYNKNDDFTGARLAVIQCGDNYIMPYLDCAGGVTRDNHYHWRIAKGGYSYSCALTNGLLMSDDDDEDDGDGTWCDYCEHRVDDVVMVHGRHLNEVYWCGDCVSEHAFTCDHSGDRYSTRSHSLVEMHNGDTWHLNAFELHGFRCERTEENFPLEELVTVRVADPDHEGEIVTEVWSKYAAQLYGGEIIEEVITQDLLEAAGQQRLELGMVLA